jgi:glycosyltransferase involved in cell wall biosynthesis
MKIAIVYDVPYPWHVGGIEAMHHNAAVELAKKHDVHFFTTKWPGMKDEFVHKGVHYHATHSTNQEKIYRHGRRSVREAALFNSSVSKLFGYDFDVVIADYFPMLHLPLVKLYCRSRGAKLIMAVAEYWDKSYWKEYIGGTGTLASVFADSAIKGADAYVTISSTTKGKMIDAGINSEKISIFAPVIDKRDFRGIRGSGKRSRTVVFSGRMVKEKRIDRFLKVIKDANKKTNGIRGMVLGSGPEKEKLMAMSKSMKLDKIVEFRDFYKDKKDLYSLIKSSSMLLNMSEREGLSIICLESIALNVPVLLPSYSPIPEEVKEMCTVSNEKNLASAASKIVTAKDSSIFIKNRDNLDRYFVSETNRFYSRLFKSIETGD